MTITQLLNAHAASLSEMGVPLGVAKLAAAVPQVPEGKDALIYCDGACSGNNSKNTSPGGFGVLVRKDNGQLEALFGGSSDTTNNKMELTAAIEALKRMPPGARVVLRTDSQYVIKCCTEWRAGRVRRGMTNSKGEGVANAELWKELWDQVDTRKVSFEWVRGHNGDAGNEIADSLAVLGCMQHKR